ncbi:TetR/AcrR family transcriptional regulator [Granulicoccus phenolivorans]|uniref:TetR/AcrR family transcriptional regulator n=1 Tax=Granulicoccus phenolivorans TaxID=266854 RepID=UPI00040491EB|nr:TetR/AcrR family transcriptional regulator [Granulicoccus phenolivorans]
MTTEPAAAVTRTQRMPRDQRRAQLLDIASGVFADKGYHNAAMDEIAEAAGVSKPVLYQHFPGKLDLYLALVQRACVELLQMVENALGSTHDNHDRVVAVVTGVFNFVEHNRDGFRFIFQSDLTGEPQVHDLLWQVNNDMASSIGRVIAEDTGLSRDEAQLLGVSLVGVAQVSARHWAAEARTEMTEQHAAELVATLVWRGISGFPRLEAEETPPLP